VNASNEGNARRLIKICSASAAGDPGFGLRRVHHDTNHDVDAGGCRRRVRRTSPSLSHEVLDGGRIGIAADDVKPGASKRACHAHSHRAEADHRRVTSNSSVHCSH